MCSRAKCAKCDYFFVYNGKSICDRCAEDEWDSTDRNERYCNTCGEPYGGRDNGIAGACGSCTKRCFICEEIFFSADSNEILCPKCTREEVTRGTKIMNDGNSIVRCPYCTEAVPLDALNGDDMCPDCAARGVRPKTIKCQFPECRNPAEVAHIYCSEHISDNEDMLFD